MSEIRLRGRSTSRTLHLTTSPGFDDLSRVGDEAVRQRGDVGEAVLVDADVDEGAERGDVGHDPFERHARPEVLQLLDALLEGGRAESRPWIAPRFVELGEDVGDGRQAERVVDERPLARADAAQRCCRSARATRARSRQDPPRRRGRPRGGRPRNRAGRRHRGSAGSRPPARRPWARAAATCLRAARVRKGPLASRWVTMLLRECSPDAGDSRQQRRGGGVDVDADSVDAALDHRVERALRDCLRRHRAGTGRRRWTCGSILTSSASGSWSRRAIETAPRRETSRSGSSSRGERRGGVDGGAGLGDDHFASLELGVQPTELARRAGRSHARRCRCRSRSAPRDALAARRASCRSTRPTGAAAHAGG